MNSKNDKIQQFRNAGIYLVITNEFTSGRPILDVLRAAAEGGIKLVQLREKSLSKKDLFKLAVEFRKVCDEYGVLMIMNDHVDIALACGADGVHLGQDDLPLEPAVKIAPNLIIGRSTHSTEQALEAQNLGADYVNLGPIYPTGTKNTPVKPLGVEIIRSTAPELGIPFTVMGGIKAHHIPDLKKSGAKIIAMVTEITQASDITARVRELLAIE